MDQAQTVTVRLRSVPGHIQSLAEVTAARNEWTSPNFREREVPRLSATTLSHGSTGPARQNTIVPSINAAATVWPSGEKTADDAMGPP